MDDKDREIERLKKELEESKKREEEIERERKRSEQEKERIMMNSLKHAEAMRKEQVEMKRMLKELDKRMFGGGKK